MNSNDLFTNLSKWLQEAVVKNRLENNEKGYDWVYSSIGYHSPLSIKDYQKFFDRSALNSEYAQRYSDTSIANKKPYCYRQTEINLIYSFHKCFAMRNQTRLQLYRNDLSQKGKRTKNSLFAALGKLEFLKDKIEQPL
jgi:hypothetical protein